tara:strand:+ start:27329 stop:27988 length:660 start_codon:yes stop_codon:yes gene_type:complete
MSDLAEIKKNPTKVLAIELIALNPNITNKELASKLGVHLNTITTWRKDANFIDATYKRFLTEIESKDLPLVVKSMVREAKEGNVQAARLLLEHLNKLVKNHHIVVSSPWEKFMQKEDTEIEVEEDVAISIDYEDINGGDLPERKVENQDIRVRTENIKNRKAIAEEEKKAERNKKQKEWYKWRVRAKKAGVEPLKNKRPTPAQRKAWERSIIEAENETN